MDLDVDAVWGTAGVTFRDRSNPNAEPLAIWNHIAFDLRKSAAFLGSLDHDEYKFIFIPPPKSAVYLSFPGFASAIENHDEYLAALVDDLGLSDSDFPDGRPGRSIPKSSTRI